MLKKLIESTSQTVFTDKDIDSIIRKIDGTGTVQHKGALNGEWSFHLTVDNRDKDSYQFAGGDEYDGYSEDGKLFIDIAVSGNVARKSRTKGNEHSPFSPVIFRWVEDGTFKLVYDEYPGSGGAPKFQQRKITNVEEIITVIKVYMKEYYNKAVKDFKLM